MTQQDFVVSADGHVLEPTDLFLTRLPKHLRERGVWEEDFEIEPFEEGGARIFRRLHTPGFEGWTISRYRQTGGRMPEGDFIQDLLGTRVRLNFSSDLQLTSFVQYDSESDSFGTNTRLRWTFNPLGDLFVVYNHNLRTRDPVTLRRELVFGSNQLLVKMQYAFRY